MKLVILYRPNSEHATLVESFSERLLSAMPEASVDNIDIDNPEGISLLETYGIMQFPALLVIADNGSMINSWLGDLLPPVELVIDNLRK
jgi:hypothetical protein